MKNIFIDSDSGDNSLKPYVSPAGAWAMALGTSIGWGSLFVTSNTYLTQAGPAGTILGLLAGMVIMLIISRNYHYMMNCFPDAGGAYAYAKETFGYDYGFITAWFLALTYFSMFWANVTALPLFSRYFFGDLFKKVYMYTLFGAYDVYLGEVLLSVAAIVIFAAVCIADKKLSMRILIGSVLVFSIGITLCTAVALIRMGAQGRTMEPAFIPDADELSQIVRIACISPWAFIGFENTSHASEEFTFPGRRIFRILTIAVVSSTLLYVLLTLLSVAAYPAGYNSWLEYLQAHGSLTGLEGLPPFFVANYYMGSAGVNILMICLLTLIFSSLIGNILALSRLLYALAKDGVMHKQLGSLNNKQIPAAAIVFIAAVSLFIPLLGRTAVGWIVDVTTIGATMVYGVVSGTTYKLADIRGDKAEKRFGAAGFVLMMLFAALLLLPSLFGSGQLSPETYFLFTIWAILGFFFFRNTLSRDKARRFGKSVVVWIALLGMIIFTTLVWMGEESITSVNESVSSVRSYYINRIVEDARIEAYRETHAVWSEIKEMVNEESLDLAYEDERWESEIQHIRKSNTQRVLTVFVLFMISIGILLNNYSLVLRRAEENEIELGVAMEKAYKDTLTGVKSRRMMSEYEKNIDAQISEGTCGDLAVVVCDVNDLKYINDTFGHKAGDEYIRSASRMICNVFRHSPVFRIGGDEFMAILTGEDYYNRERLMDELYCISVANIGTDKAIVAAGIAEYQAGIDESMLFIVNRADKDMYHKKEEIKARSRELRND